jgi:hypothetical protein
MNNYGELRAQVADLLNRSDLTTKIPDFVRLAESRIYRGLRATENEFTATYDNTGWVIQGHAATPYVPGASAGIHENLPPNYRQMSLVTWNGTGLENKSLQRLTVLLDDNALSLPGAFAITGRRIQFASAIGSDPADWLDEDRLVYTYFGTESLNSLPTWQVGTNPVRNPAVEDTTPEDLSHTDANTTRMFQRHPDLYLFGAAYYGAIHLQSDLDIGKYGALFREVLDEIKMESKRARYSGSTNRVTSAY